MVADGTLIGSDPLNTTDGFIRISNIMQLGKGETFKAVIADESGKQIAVGIFHRNDIELGDAIHIKILKESDKMYQIYYNSTSRSHGFVSANPVWIPKDTVSVITGRVIRVIVGGRLTALKCGHCGFVLVMAVGSKRTLAVCSKCKRADHVV